MGGEWHDNYCVFVNRVGVDSVSGPNIGTRQKRLFNEYCCDKVVRIPPLWTFSPESKE